MVMLNMAIRDETGMGPRCYLCFARAERINRGQCLFPSVILVSPVTLCLVSSVDAECRQWKPRLGMRNEF